MASVNKVILVGNLGGNPEVRYTANQVAVGNFSMCTNTKVKNGDNYEDVPEWHRVVLWNKTAENAGKYLTKGSSVYVEGRLQTRKWTDNNGQDRYTTEVVANTVQYLNAKGENVSGAVANNPATQAMGNGIDEIPF